MAESSQDIQQTLNRIRTIELRARHLVDEMFAGSYHSVFKGQGMNFEEVREYQAGDEIRTIDWNVTARFSEPYVKQFTEERQLLVLIVVDLSASGNFGSSESSKREVAAEVAATLALSATRNSDRVGLILFSEDIELFIPPSKGRSHVLRIIREVLYRKPKHKGTDLAQALEYLHRVVRNRSIAFVLSDFMAPDFTQELSLVRRRHDLVAIRIEDPLEKELPDIGRVVLQDEETGEQMEIDTSNKAVREAHARRISEQDDQLNRLWSQHGIDALSLQTNEDCYRGLQSFFDRREKRIHRS
ncbi:MAG: DUF58 domain-containing protein [Verrucomicrobiota bacterium]